LLKREGIIRIDGKKIEKKKERFVTTLTSAKKVKLKQTFWIPHKEWRDAWYIKCATDEELEQCVGELQAIVGELDKIDAREFLALHLHFELLTLVAQSFLRTASLLPTFAQAFHH
jgi:hypothetical protein